MLANFADSFLAFRQLLMGRCYPTLILTIIKLLLHMTKYVFTIEAIFLTNSIHVQSESSSVFIIPDSCLIDILVH